MNFLRNLKYSIIICSYFLKSPDFRQNVYILDIIFANIYHLQTCHFFYSLRKLI
jgi:hypothetical protein